MPTVIEIDKDKKINRKTVTCQLEADRALELVRNA